MRSETLYAGHRRRMSFAAPEAQRSFALRFSLGCIIPNAGPQSRRDDAHFPARFAGGCG